MSARRLIEKGYLIDRKLGSQYVNFTETTKEAWLMDVYEGNDELLHGLPDARSAYGVNIYIMHKGYQLAAVRTALEKQFGKSFERVLTTHRPTIWPVNLTGYKLVLNPSTTLFLRRATSGQGDPYYQYDTLRIAIGYNLSEEQQEYFAISADGIADDD